jgi:iron complex outermembrane receptor protein
VTTDTGEPLVGASLVITGPDSRVGGISGSDGRFSVAGVPSGRQTLTVSFVGYAEEVVRQVEIAPDETTWIDIDMEPTAYRLTETVVSASLRGENVIDAPTSISKVEAAQIRGDAVAGSYVGAIRNVRGIDHFQSNVIERRVNARGFNSAFNYRMLVLIDGRVSQFPTIGLPLYVPAPTPKEAIQDMEVILGPGAAHYGPDATAGVISTTTKDPRRYQRTILTASVGSRETRRVGIFHSGTQDRWGWRVAGGVQRAREYELVNTFYSPDSTLSQSDDPDFDAQVLRGEAGLFYYPDDGSRWGFVSGAAVLTSSR